MPTTPHSAAGWRIDPPVSEPRPSGAKPAATAAAEPPLLPPGTLPVSRGLRVGPKAEFSVELPMANSSMFVLPSAIAPARAQRLDDGGVVGRAPALEDLRAARGRDAPRAQVVLQRDGHAGQRAGVAPCGHGGVDRVGLRPGLVAEDGEERVELAVAGRHRGQRLLHHLTGRSLPDRTCDAASASAAVPACPRHGASPPIRGTRKRWSSTAGAAASTSSRSRLGRGSSGRSTFSSAMGWDDGSRWARSSAATSAAWSSTVRSCAVKSSTSSSLRSSRARCATWTTSSRLSVTGAGVPLARPAHGRGGGSRPVTNSTVRASISSLS